jgi:hypothetical protein
LWAGMKVPLICEQCALCGVLRFTTAIKKMRNGRWQRVQQLSCRARAPGGAPIGFSGP